MNSEHRQTLLYEVTWLIGIIAVSAVIEYAIILLFDLHPILSVKIQGFIGLVIVAYGIRTLARLGKSGVLPLVDDEEENTSDQERHPHL